MVGGSSGAVRAVRRSRSGLCAVDDAGWVGGVVARETVDWLCEAVQARWQGRRGSERAVAKMAPRGSHTAQALQTVPENAIMSARAHHGTRMAMTAARCVALAARHAAPSARRAAGGRWWIRMGRTSESSVGSEDWASSDARRVALRGAFAGVGRLGWGSPSSAAEPAREMGAAGLRGWSARVASGLAARTLARARVVADGWAYGPAMCLACSPRPHSSAAPTATALRARANSALHRTACWPVCFNTHPHLDSSPI